MGTTENKRLVADFFRDLEASLHGEDIDLTPYLAEEVSWWLPRSLGALGFPNEYQGREQVLALFAGVGTVYHPDSVRFELDELLAEGDRVAVPFTLRALTAGGNDYENDYQSIITLREGKILAVREILDTARLRSILESSPPG